MEAVGLLICGAIEKHLLTYLWEGALLRGRVLPTHRKHRLCAGPNPLWQEALLRGACAKELPADCQVPGSAPEPYARQSGMGYLCPFTFYRLTRVVPGKGLLNGRVCHCCAVRRTLKSGLTQDELAVVLAAN